ncbi:MAG: PAQR family membrane homeostasis protein TrhA [Spirochaetales bacterium]
MNREEGPITRWLFDHITLKPAILWRYELANGLTHALGIALSVVATAMFVVLIAQGVIGGALAAASLVYGFTMIVLYASSTGYHLMQGPIAKRIARIMDHVSIYFLIAGTYTPVMVYIDTPASRTVLIIAWAVTVIGVLFTLRFWGRYGVLHVLFYLAMGWMIVLIWEDVIDSVSASFIRWGIAGGISYTVGTIFYGMQKLPYNHAIWHLFVLGGSICFFFGIYLELLL